MDLRHPAEQVLADPDGVGHGGEGRVHRPDAGEEAGVHDVQVVQLVGLAVDVEHRRGRVVAEPAGPGLVGAAGDRDAHVHVEVLVEYVVLGHPDVVEDLPELVVEPGGLGGVGRGVGQVNAPVAVHGHAVAGLGHVLSGQPEVHGVTSHVRQAPVRRQQGELGLLALHRLRVRLPGHLDVPERPFAAVPGEVEVVQAERLLEHRVVALLAQGDHGLAVVVHVVAADQARAVGQAIRVPVGRRPEQDGGTVRRPGSYYYDVGLVHILLPVTVDHDGGDGPAARIGLEAPDFGVDQQGDVFLIQDRAHRDDVRVGLGVYQARIAIAPGAPDALAGRPVRLVEQDAARRVERVVARTGQGIGDLLDPRLV